MTRSITGTGNRWLPLMALGLGFVLTVQWAGASPAGTEAFAAAPSSQQAVSPLSGINPLAGDGA